MGFLKKIGKGLGKVAPLAATAVGGPLAGAAVSTGINAIEGVVSNGNQRPSQQQVPIIGYGHQGFAYGGNTVPYINGYQEYNGATHANGGIVTSFGEVEDGETRQGDYIFSNRLPVPGENKSFAEKHKEIKDDPKEVKKLMKLQESIKSNNENGGEQFRYGGGYKTKKYANGGFPSVDNINIPGINGEAPGVDFSNAKAQPLQTNNDGFNFSKAVPYTSAALNVGRGLFGDINVAQPTEVDRSGINNMSTEFNVNPQLRANNRSFRSAVDAFENSPNNMLAGLSKKFQADSDIYSRKENIENQLQNRKASATQQANVRDAHELGRFRREKNFAQNRKRDMLFEGLNQGAQTFQAQKRLENMSITDQKRMELLSLLISDPKAREFLQGQLN